MCKYASVRHSCGHIFSTPTRCFNAVWTHLVQPQDCPQFAVELEESTEACLVCAVEELERKVEKQREKERETVKE
jgi:hypothetical protein